MSKKNFISFRQSSDISEEEMDKFFEENSFKTVGDLMIAAEYDVWKDLIETGDIFSCPVTELFSDLDNEATVLLMERINEIIPTDYISKGKDFLKKMNKWLTDYKRFCKIREIKKKPMPVTNTKQQLLLIHYLEKAKLINLNKIHQDQTKQARLLSMLFSKGYDNVYKDLKKSTTTKYEEEFDKVYYLQPIYELFVSLGIRDIAPEIEQKIKNLQAKVKK